MAKQKRCSECGVPEFIHKDLVWQENGIITETKDPDHRMLFSESGNLEGLLAEIGNIIGLSIDKVVVESKRKATKEYLEKIISPLFLKLLYTFNPGLIFNRISKIGKAYGYGDIKLVEVKKHTERGDYLAITVDHSYSILSFQGDTLAGMELGTGRECTVKMKEIGDDKFLLELWVAEHPSELDERLQPKTYPIQEGSVRLERCPKCNVPLAVSAYNFDLDTGIISDPETGARMAIYGPVGTEAAFLALEEELGDTIPETIIEAQRRYSRDHFQVRDWAAGEESLRRMIAMRGYGILTSLDASPEHFSATIINPSVIYVIVGMAKGVFERAMKADSSIHKWSVSEAGELSIDLRKVK